MFTCRIEEEVVAMTGFSTDSLKLDPREVHFRVPGPHRGLSLFLRYLTPNREAISPSKPVLYVHGGTFPLGALDRPSLCRPVVAR